MEPWDTGFVWSVVDHAGRLIRLAPDPTGVVLPGWGRAELRVEPAYVARADGDRLHGLVLEGQDIVVVERDPDLSDLIVHSALGLTSEERSFLGAVMWVDGDEKPHAVPVRASSRPRSLGYWAQYLARVSVTEVLAGYTRAIEQVSAGVSAIQSLGVQSPGVAFEVPDASLADMTYEEVLASGSARLAAAWAALAGRAVEAARDNALSGLPKVSANEDANPRVGDGSRLGQMVTRDVQQVINGGNLVARAGRHG